MTCYHPLHRFVRGMRRNKNGKLVEDAVIVSGKTKYLKCGTKIIETFEEIPCGKCIGCRLEYSKNWAIRCMLEAKKHEKNCMLTLTYDDLWIPKGHRINGETGEVSESNTLCKKDVTLFLKRLRKKYTFRYYMCGEYGDLYGRPHYHIIMFGFEPQDKELYRINAKGFPVWKSEILSKIWGKGYVTSTEFCFDAAAYVARYVMKKRKGPEAKIEYELSGQVPEYTNMSRKPGIAREFFNEKGELLYETQKTWIQTQKGLLEVKPPRYYDKLFDELHPEEFAKIKKARKELALMRQEMMLKSTDLNREEYMLQMEKIAEKKIKTKSRNYEQEH